ncbi:NitT/TauT family transport system permease protein [Halanaerobium salsuginis]|jgi:NitT/TauT family transport system permease protein|uniref:NitT/TauT family transport system permease protein n=2 Tax=Halanaerobium salsuginis TaxID=29563 RepID=A0A1I4H532_9FIRM|nr:NitT/TauT family transport system permease protein [Halanaerobium salsuginis]
MISLPDKFKQRLGWILLLALIWQLIAASHFFSELIFPGLDKIILTLFTSLTNGNLLKQLIFSLIIIAQGLTLTVILALSLSILAYFSELAASLLETLTALAHPLPGIALMPLILIWFGAGKTAILLVIIHSVLWPLILNLRAGFNAMPSIYNLIAQNYCLTKLEFLFKILFPAALPYFISGLKISWARSWRALISAEMLFGAINSLGGIGWYIFQRRVFFDLPGVFAGLVVIILIGIIVEDFIFARLEAKTVQKWGMSK